MTNIQHHLRETKLRFFYLLLSGICSFFLCYNFQLEIVYIIAKPFIELQQNFVFLELTEAFYTILRISIILSLLVMIPFFFYQIWSFFIPSVYKIERNRINFILLLIFFLFLTEILFAYFFLFPKLFHFLLSYEIASETQNSNSLPFFTIEFSARMSSYVELLVKISSLILVLFQFPLCVCLLYSKKLLDVSIFYFNRKGLGLLSLLLSAVIVPPDVLSQLVVACFFFLVFEFLIFIGLFFE